MLLANIFLLLWHYDRLKFLLPIKDAQPVILPRPIKYSNKFPVKFTLVSTTILAGVIAGIYAMRTNAVMPENSISDCMEQFEGTNRTTAGAMFCDCVHVEGLPLDTCLEKYWNTPNDSPQPPKGE